MCKVCVHKHFALDQTQLTFAQDYLLLYLIASTFTHVSVLSLHILLDWSRLAHLGKGAHVVRR